MAMRGSATMLVGAPADDAFTRITDLEHLHDWNDIIREVVERPAELAPGAEWVVELRAMGTTWRSRSRVTVFDPSGRRFEYRSQTDDGNPSYVDWCWHVDDDARGALVTVTWDLHPATFWRRTLLARVRNRQLRGEVSDSLRALDRLLAGTPGAS